jgi:hypothetical protein
VKILLACECSGIVREAFRHRGHDAISADLLPTELPGPHIVGDVTQLLREPWDMVIAFPPCTYLSYAGTAHWHAPGRAEKREAAMEFFMACYRANATKVAVENPFGWPCQQFRPPDQIINPFDFGEPIRKRTCLWLRGLPKIFRADEIFAVDGIAPPVAAPEPIYVGTRIATGKPKARYETDCVGGGGKRRVWHWTESLPHSGDRRRERSRTFQSIANAMAVSWG